ncbi:MAG: PilT/PilU family type 4a pilus ATPase, partial [Candidatus Sumerlaeia bacterium]|nr:PilT/PilU family type 4a pilus ATPase [Candidatus Sumerlaeia bacterium]
MSSSETKFIQIAFQRRLLTRKQAELIREELETFPGESAGYLMLRRHYITEDQLADLNQELSEHHATDGSMPEEDFDEPTAGTTDAEYDPTATQKVDPSQIVQPEPDPEPEPIEPAAQAKVNMPRNLAGFLQLARHWKASDMHLSVGRPPFFRIDGTHRYMDVEPLSPELAQQLNFSALNETQAEQALRDLQLDFALEVRGVGRYRCNVFKHRLGWDGSYRVISTKIPTVEDLGLPTSVKVLTEYQQGLVMITGPGGSVKTTTAYALLDLVNQRRRDHIITVEDPVEYILRPAKCQIMQREVGRHTKSFATALRAALREDPDIILVGEMRDLETTSIAISAAETGHLVFGTLGTSTAARTVARIVDVYPISQQSQVCVMVAESLRGVITQKLLPRRDHQGRVLAYEILINTSGIAQQIKEGKSHMINSLIQNGKRQGMCLMDDTLRKLQESGVISGSMAYH